MDPSLRIVPPAPPKSASVTNTANSLGLHDTLTYGPRSLATEVNNPSEVRGRLVNWDQTQDTLKLTTLRNIHGIHAPVRLLMERKIVSSTPHLPTHLPTSNLALDILMGRDDSLEPCDFFGGQESGPATTFHQEMEKNHRL